MPSVLCGLRCFDVLSSTAGDAAREFSAALAPSVDCGVEVYRLERLSIDEPLSAEELVLCCIPGWHFDFAALESLHGDFESLQEEHEGLQIQYSRTHEAFLALNESFENLEAAQCGETRDVQQLRRQLATSERKQQDTKITVMALRGEFMHLVNMMSENGSRYQHLELRALQKELDGARTPWQDMRGSTQIARHADKLGVCRSLADDVVKPARHVSQPPAHEALRSAAGARGGDGPRRPAGSPRPHRSGVPGSFTAPAPRSRLRGFHHRSGHSAGAPGRNM